MNDGRSGSQHLPQKSIVRSRLDRDRIVELLGEMAGSLASRSQDARIRIVGGSAIALMYSSGRDVTADVDAISDPEGVVLSAADDARRRHPDLSDDWFNGAAGQYLPNGFGRAQEWVEVFSERGVVIEVPSAEMLLAMKIDAAQRRGRRDGIDLPHLLSAAGVSTAGDAEKIYEDFYAGDELTERTYKILEFAVKQSESLNTTIAAPSEIGAEIRSSLNVVPPARKLQTRFPELYSDDEPVFEDGNDGPSMR